MVSIITPAFNSENFIAQTIESVLKQTYSEWEYIIVDDGSTDSTSLVIEKYLTDKRIKYFKQENKGCSSARNKGIKEAKGEYIAILDSDDQYYPEKLEKQIKYMQSMPDCIALGSNADVIDAEGNLLFTTVQCIENVKIKASLPVSPFVNSSLVFRRTIFDKYKYEEKLKYAEDGCFINQIAGEGEFWNMPDILIRYRINPESKGRRSRKNGDIILSIFMKLKNKAQITDEDIEVINEIHAGAINYAKNEYYSYLCYLYFTYNINIDKKRFKHLIIKALLQRPLYLYNYYYLIISIIPSFLISLMFNKKWFH